MVSGRADAMNEAYISLAFVVLLTFIVWSSSVC